MVAVPLYAFPHDVAPRNLGAWGDPLTDLLPAGLILLGAPLPARLADLCARAQRSALC